MKASIKRATSAGLQRTLSVVFVATDNHVGGSNSSINFTYIEHTRSLLERRHTGGTQWVWGELVGEP